MSGQQVWHAASFQLVTHVLTDLGALGGPSNESGALDVNAGGDIVGWSKTGSGIYTKAFRWSGGSMQQIGPTSDALIDATGIDEDGRVSIRLNAGDMGESKAYLWVDGVLTQLPKPSGAQGAFADGVGGSGTVIGHVDVNFPCGGQCISGQPYRWVDGIAESLYAWGTTTDINCRGDIVGLYRSTPTGTNAPGIWHGATSVVDDLSSWIGSDGVPVGISDGRTVVANTFVGGVSHAVMLLPDIGAGFPWSGLGACGVLFEQTFGSCSMEGDDALTGAECNGDAVNSRTGTLTLSETDLETPGTGVSFEWTRSYNSQDYPPDFPAARLGTSWTDGYASSLSEMSWGDVLLRSGTGQQVWFYKLADGSFKGAAGALSKLTKTATTFELVRRDQTMLVFDLSGRLSSIVDRNGQGLTFGYDGTGRLTTITDSAGRIATIAYNASDFVSSVTTHDSRSVSYTYDANGALATVTDVRGKVWTYGSDGFQRLLSIQDPLGHYPYRVTYDESGRVDTMLDGVGNQTSYDGAFGTQVATITDANGGIWTDEYDSYGRLETRTDGAGNATTFTLDVTLNTTGVRSPANETTSMTYDAGGNVLTAVAPPSLNNAQKTFTYNASNDPVSVTDARGKITGYGYTAAGNVQTVTQDGQQVASYTYDSAGRPLTSTDGNGKTTDYTYSPAGYVASVTGPDPDGAGPLPLPVTSYTYDGQGNVLTRVDPKGNVAGCGCAANTRRRSPTTRPGSC